MYYYLGVRDGLSASLDSLNRRNPEPLKDAKWRVELRSYLPPELAALRQPNPNTELAARIIEREFMQVLHRTKRQSQSHRTSKYNNPVRCRQSFGFNQAENVIAG
jgi:hypothetical protein